MNTIEAVMSPERAAKLSDVRVAVLSGGTSGEREVSLISGRAVCAALRQSVAAAQLAQARELEIDAQGRWLIDGVAHSAASALHALSDIDVYFLGLHGGSGENGTIQGLLAAAGKCHTGSGVGASALCMDKAATRGLAGAAGLRLAPGHLINPRGFAAQRSVELERAVALSPHGAWVVKPRRGGSSVNTHLVRAGEQLEAAIADVLGCGDDALVEACVVGVEVSCGVLDFAGSVARALPPIEIQPAPERFFDFQQKYSESGARELCPASSLSAHSDTQVRAAALALHHLCGCHGYSRSDFIVPPQGEPVLLEINTLPGMTPRSLLPQEAAVDGLAFEQLCLCLVEDAWVRSRS
jgi:D-alanine-D-alanine ligase